MGPPSGPIIAFPVSTGDRDSEEATSSKKKRKRKSRKKRSRRNYCSGEDIELWQLEAAMPVKARARFQEMHSMGFDTLQGLQRDVYEGQGHVMPVPAQHAATASEVAAAATPHRQLQPLSLTMILALTNK